MENNVTAKQPIVVPIFFDTYLAVIKNNISTNTFRNLFALVDGKKMDIMNNGNLSCAWFASSLLVLSRSLKEPHATVNGTISDLEASG